MARLNPLLGRMKGKYGGSVMYSYNGKQCMRERVIEVRNPRSSKQAIQRAILATCGRFVSAFVPILNNSLQSESSKVNTLAKIRSMNMDMLRQLAAAGDGAYTEKGSMYVAPNPYVISRGSLPGLTPLTSPAALTYLSDDGQLLFPWTVINGGNMATSTASQTFPGIAVGDQITILASYMEDYAEGSRVGYCRFAFKDDTTPVFKTVESSQRLNPAAIDLTKAEGPWDSLVFGTDSVDGVDVTYIAVGPLCNGNAGDPVDIAGIIVSREAGKMRSNATMVVNPSAGSEYTLDQVYPTYMEGGYPIDMPSDVYLNNDSNATPAPFAWITNVNGTSVVLPKSLNVSSTASTLCVLHGKSLPAAFNMQVKFSIEGSGAQLTANFTNTSSGTTGGITFELDGSNNIAVTASVASTINVASIRYYDGDGNDITWN